MHGKGTGSGEYGFKKKDMHHKYLWVRNDGSTVVEKALMDFIVVHIVISGIMLEVNVLRAESGGMFDCYFVEGRQIVSERWRKQRNYEGREVLKVSKLHENEKEREYLEKLREM